jgi:hypothetical protein
MFMVAMDTMEWMMEMAADPGLLGRVLPKEEKLRCSLYIDDAGVFVTAVRRI